DRPPPRLHKCPRVRDRRARRMLDRRRGSRPRDLRERLRRHHRGHPGRLRLRLRRPLGLGRLVRPAHPGHDRRPPKRSGPTAPDAGDRALHDAAL
ncbi:MAG: hypothetical protein AVDCRST_MAG17-505, partial [uncultured Solirubrobacterales bacterium]